MNKKNSSTVEEERAPDWRPNANPALTSKSTQIIFQIIIFADQKEDG
jgi:hypothetical protein